MGSKSGKFAHGSLNCTCHGVCGAARGNLHAFLWNRLRKARPKAEAALHVCAFESHQIAMNGYRVGVRRPTLAAKVRTTTRVEITFDAVAFPQTIVRGEISRAGIQSPQPGVKGLLMPQVEELGGLIAQPLGIQAEILNRGRKRGGEFAQLPVDPKLPRVPGSPNPARRGPNHFAPPTAQSWTKGGQCR